MTRLVVSDPEEGKAYQIEPEDSQLRKLVGLRIGDKINGEDVGLPGYELKITGGSDEEGFAMRPDVRGEGRTRALLSSGTGYKPKRNGERKRKTVRGNRVSEKIAQLNTKIVKKGKESIEEIIGLETEELEKSEEE